MLFAAGLITGEALMGILMAIPIVVAETRRRAGAARRHAAGWLDGRNRRAWRCSPASPSGCTASAHANRPEPGERGTDYHPCPSSHVRPDHPLPVIARAKLIVCFATVYLVWGSTYVVASIGVHVLPPLLFGGFRFLCAGVLLALTAIALGQRFELDAAEWRHLLIVAVGSVFIPNGCTNWAMQHVASNQTAILNASAALWIALLATRGRRAHAIDRRTLIGLVVGFAGTVLIIWPRGSLAFANLDMQFLILFAVFVWSATTVYIRNAHSKLGLLAFSAIQMFLGGVMMTGTGLALGEADRWHWSMPGLLVHGLSDHREFVRGIHRVFVAGAEHHARDGRHLQLRESGDRGRAGLVVSDEQFGVNQIIGMAVMFAGVALVSWPQKEAKRLDEDQQKEPSTAG